MKLYLLKNNTLKDCTPRYFDANCFQTVVFVCSDETLKYFIEYAVSLNLFSFVTTFNSKHENLEILPLFTDAHIDTLFVYPTNLENERIFEFAKRKNCCLFNSEQMSIPSRRGPIVTFLQKGGNLINYSEENAHFLKKHCLRDNQMVFLPYLCQEVEKLSLFRLISVTEKTFDFALCCNMTPRRWLIAKAMMMRGIKLNIITDCFGAERDRRIAQCRALLNIHATNEYTVYESIRCNRWLAAGGTVVSEKCSDALITVPSKENFFHVDENSLVDFCALFAKKDSLLTVSAKDDAVRVELIIDKECFSTLSIREWLERNVVLHN